MLRRLLQFCLVAFAVVFLAGEAVACPHHQMSSAGHAAHAASVQDAVGMSNVAQGVDVAPGVVIAADGSSALPSNAATIEGSAPHVHTAGHAPRHASHPSGAAPADEVAASGAGLHGHMAAGRTHDAGAVSLVAQAVIAAGGGEHACCGTAGCVHAGACASTCCASPTVASQSWRQPERRFALGSPPKAFLSLLSIASAPTLATHAEDRRLWREAEALRPTLHEPRLARVARLTI